MNEEFDIILYNQLSLQDRELINEYLTKLKAPDLNSFMKRLVDYYGVENKDILEVKEDLDSVLVLEKSVIFRATVGTTINQSYLPFDLAFNFFAKRFSKKQEIAKVFYNYFKEEFNKAILNIKDLNIEFDSYLNDNNSKKLLLENNILWQIDNNLKSKLKTEFLNTNNRNIFKLNNIKIKCQQYLFRNEKNKKFFRLGLALNSTVLSKVKLKGFTPNYKVYNIMVTYNNCDLSQYIKSAGYWSPNNSLYHNFNNRCGIIWLEGKQIDNKRWRLPNGVIVENNNKMNLSCVLTTDAIAKKIQRLKINKLINEMLLEFESLKNT